MAVRRSLLAIVLLAAALHAIALSWTLLPAQDGLKFIRIARQFQLQPWEDVVRGSDQHPLYPALVALAEPVAAAVVGPGPDAWRIAAQGVSILAALAVLVPLHGLTRALFDDRVALLATLIYILLPLPAAIGHDTLSDSLALLGAVLALRLGEVAIRSGARSAWLGCGLVAGLGYLARPEVVLVPVAVVLTLAARWRGSIPPRSVIARASTLAITFLAIVGMYALVKGQVSEKLALRQAAALEAKPLRVRKVGQWLPPGLDDLRWDFSPKEESEEPAYRSAGPIVRRLFLRWAEGLCGVFAFFAAWGVARDRFIRTLCAQSPATARAEGRSLIAIYLAVFSLVLVRHALRLGYLSDRHMLTLVAVSIPWAGAGTFVCARGIAVALGWGQRRARAVGAMALALLIAVGIAVQQKSAHPSRWGHWAAGRWLIEHAVPSDAVLDTRGWAAFVSGLPSYDYWHVCQAFTDAHLAYIVVGTDELSASSRRAATLRAVLAYAASPVAAFPERRNGRGEGVRVYRYHRPCSWEGLRP
ncbi:MAG: glycosyltransferase family 39 protein [Planctomycetaceae bacterium]|nr:glycosyltransferase family 39 protein [Planctomycetaceae bacterium]